MPEFKVGSPRELPSAVMERRRRAAIDDLVTTWDCAPMASVSDGPTDDDYLAEFLPEGADPQDRVFKTRVAALVGLSEQNASVTGVELLEQMKDLNERWLLCEGWITELMKDPDRRASARTIADIIVHSLPNELLNSTGYEQLLTPEEVHIRLLRTLASVGEDIDRERLIHACETVLDRLDNDFFRETVLIAWDTTDYEPLHEGVQSYAEIQSDPVNRFRILCEIAHYPASIQDIRTAVLAGLRLLQQPQRDMDEEQVDHEIKKVLRACGRRVLRAGHPRHLIPEKDCKDLHAALATHPEYQATLEAALQIGDLSLIAEVNERGTTEKS